MVRKVSEPPWCRQAVLEGGGRAHHSTESLLFWALLGWLGMQWKKGPGIHDNDILTVVGRRDRLLALWLVQANSGRHDGYAES